MSWWGYFIDKLLAGGLNWKVYGFALNFIYFVYAVMIGSLFHDLLSKYNWIGLILEVFLVSVWVAQTGLIRHVVHVLDATYCNNLFFARCKLMIIVSRNVVSFDEYQISSTVILSLIENFNDATFLPIWFYLLMGLPGLIFFKLVNTADSIYGNLKCQSDCMAKTISLFDDVICYVPSRIACLFMMCSFKLINFKFNVFQMLADSFSYISINSSVNESLIAYSLNLQLGGDRVYSKEFSVKDRVLNLRGNFTDVMHALKCLSFINYVYILILVLVIVV